MAVDQSVLVQAVKQAIIASEFEQPLTADEEALYDQVLTARATTLVAVFQAFNTANSGS